VYTFQSGGGGEGEEEEGRNTGRDMGVVFTALGGLRLVKALA